ncbi:hypothetical protein A3X26_22525 [Salmonella enterica subsp. enterica serovar Typhimurium]|uniref:Uncharacterized protein n=3 Tax=Enterobacteriaceae TaxID=543 RepID=J7FNH1_CITFR|nr:MULTISPECIES: hypothetical protein [Enterobacteriaceae]EAU5548175.1 hypothetical protein [Salmonella enterica]EBI0098920.1 hypothetical protein [Salmonella enterica subsp. enterica serovar Johannesburg]ECB6490705.1 hypothetical protein [Salmonella enterica subsp. enterica serovar Typhimurium]EKS9204816.1 hypothetical protein [Enterobacter cloacae]HAT7707400.1 hypothetical protein [Enterobacter roggenkampii]HBM2590070.1 hypothetical protein [Enterobacter hormaechei subsp. hoffmannii]HDP014
MDKIVHFTVINTFNDLLIAKASLDRNIVEINAGKRFDQFEEGHDQYVQKVTDALLIVEGRLENLKK